MSSGHTERRAAVFLGAMVVAGISLLVLPWLLTPPAYLDLALRDVTFGSDLSKQKVSITDDSTGKRMLAAVEKVDGAYLARLGRISSGAGAYTARIDGYRPATARVQLAALQRMRVPLDLKPQFGRLELTPVDATRVDVPVTATVKEGDHAVTQQPQRTLILDLPPGEHRFSGVAPGFCPTERSFKVREGKITKAVLPLSPDLKDDEIARFVLGWRNEPRDLDTHFRKTDAVGFPSPLHVFFDHKTGTMSNGTTFARLDVDELHPGKYETLTVRNAASGAFRYFVHVYQGEGTVGDADATVQFYTRGCQMQTFTPPPNCTLKIWDVVLLRYDGRRVDLDAIQRCEPEGTVAVRK